MKERYKTLDGWRGISILLVLAGHLLPLGFGSVRMNAAIAGSGMVLFFILSGFLITSILLHDTNIKHFLIRRVLRIVPLAWLILLPTLLLTDASLHQWLSNLFFYANWPPMGLIREASHFWSLCLEMQFYLFVACLVFTFKERALWLLPILALCITLARGMLGVEMAINTYFRADEILAGCTLALIYHRAPAKVHRVFVYFNPFLLFLLLVCSAHEAFGPLNYVRPYIALLLVGSTLLRPAGSLYESWLSARFLVFTASISYALYAIHGVLRYTWLAEGEKSIVYLKRPLLFLVTFVLAYLSTKYYESYWINLGKKLTRKTELPKQEQPAV